MTYIPQLNTAPHRAIELFKSQPPGSELSTRDLAEAIKADPTTLTASLATARAVGLLSARKDQDHKLVWSLGKSAAPHIPAQPESEKTRFGLFSDGQFCIQRGELSMWLSQDELDELVRFYKNQVA